MSVRAIDRRRHARPAALALLLAASLGGCVTQEYVRGLGHHAAKGAMDGAAEGMPAMEEPLRQALRRALVEDDTLRQAATDMTETAVKSLEAGLASSEMRRQIDDLVTQAIDLHESEELKAAIHQSAHDNYVGPWLSSFLKRRGL